MDGGSFFKRAKGHDFQEERSVFGEPGDQGAPVRKDISRRAYSQYAGGSKGNLDRELQADPRYRAMQRKADFVQLFFNYASGFKLVLPRGERTYFLIQNLHPTFVMYVGFDIAPNQSATLGLQILGNGGFYEPFEVPQNDVYISGTGAGTCTVLVANG